MVEEHKKRAVIDKWKKKKQYRLICPKQFGNVEFGETVATKPEQLIGRTVKINLGVLTNQISQKHIEAKLRIVKVEGSNAQTEFAGFRVKTEYLRRLFRRRTSKVEVISTFETKDKQKVKIDAVCVTYGKQEVSKTKVIRKELFGFLEKSAKENSLEKLFELVLDHKKFFADLITKVKKITPINTIEVSKMVVVNK